MTQKLEEQSQQSLPEKTVTELKRWDELNAGLESLKLEARGKLEAIIVALETYPKLIREGSIKMTAELLMDVRENLESQLNELEVIV